jgi:hypothetical protein
VFADGRPHVHGIHGQQAVLDTDWIVANIHHPTEVYVLTDVEFSDSFQGGGPAGRE